MATQSFQHVEIKSENPQRLVDFYSRVFGWNFNKMPDFDYFMTDHKDGAGMGITGTREGMPAGMTIWAITDDPGGCVELAKAAGGSHVAGPMPTPVGGHMALLTDADGNALGVITKDSGDADG